jgi:hypothetical protein
MMTSFNAKLGDLRGSHREVRVYAGPDEDHRAFCGTLTLRSDEAIDLVAMIRNVHAREVSA